MSLDFTAANVSHVAKLASLPPVPYDKLRDFETQLKSILKYVQVIQSTDTSQVEETHQTTGLTNIMREDVVDDTRTFTQEQALANAKHTHEGYFLVPAIMGDE